MKRRAAAAAAAWCCLSLFLAGCGKSESEIPALNEPVSIETPSEGSDSFGSNDALGSLPLLPDGGKPAAPDTQPVSQTTTP